ncbi:hypothetical protein [Gordonia malaquae]
MSTEQELLDRVIDAAKRVDLARADWAAAVAAARVGGNSLARLRRQRM